MLPPRMPAPDSTSGDGCEPGQQIGARRRSFGFRPRPAASLALCGSAQTDSRTMRPSFSREISNPTLRHVHQTAGAHHGSARAIGRHMGPTLDSWAAVR